jgi:hypothetical protein
MTLAELRAIAEAATPGPWGFSDDWVISPALSRFARSTAAYGRPAAFKAADFIDACSPPTVLALLDVCEAAAKYRAIVLRDPTSLDRPSGGSKLDRALDRLEEMK